MLACPHDVAILLHENESFFSRSRYLVRYLVPIWRKRGLRVAFSRGPAPTIEASVALLHVALTRIPPDYQAGAERLDSKVLNLGVANVSKREISRNVVAYDSDWDGPVIVKTALNYAGGMEKYLAAGLSRRIRRAIPLPSAARVFRRSLIDRVACRRQNGTVESASASYSVYPSVAAVPTEAFSNDDLVVERFLPETSEGGYTLRKWIFFGAREVCLLLRSRDRIVRRWRRVDDCPRIDVAPTIRALRDAIGLDFGEIDWVESDRGPTLLDVNRPPTLAGPLYRSEIERLASGIEDYLR